MSDTPWQEEREDEPPFMGKDGPLCGICGYQIEQYVGADDESGEVYCLACAAEIPPEAWIPNPDAENDDG